MEQEELDAREIDLAEVVTAAFFNRYGYVFRAAQVVFLDQRNVELAMSAAGHAQVRRLIQNLSLRVARVTISVAYALFVFFELRRIVRLREEFLEENRVRDAIRLQILHGVFDHLAAAKRFVVQPR